MGLVEVAHTMSLELESLTSQFKLCQANSMRIFCPFEFEFFGPH